MRPKAFLIDGKPVTLERRRRRNPPRPPAASGSRAAPAIAGRVARASRLFVEGVHDATLVERVWGDDLRAEGVVVESLDGLDNLGEALAGFGARAESAGRDPVDHLVAGSKGSG